MTLQKYCFEILNAIAKPILLIDSNYQILAANSMAFNSFHLSPDDLVGRACYKITHRFEGPCWQEQTKCPVKEAFKSHKKTTAIHKHNYKGTVIIEEIIAVPVFDDQGKILFIVEELNDVTELVKSKEVIDHLRDEIKTLRDIIPICSSCRKIRDDKGYWQNVENYFRSRSEIEFTHGICPDCMRKLYPEYNKK
jgi:PAS domain S-box-containing protein